MYVHLYSNGKTLDNQKITFDEAMFLLQHQDTVKEEPDNYIGFTVPGEEDAIIQFIREKEDKWVIDLPAFVNDEFIGSYNSITDKGHVISIVSNLYVKNSAIRSSLVDKDYEELLEQFFDRWGIDFHFEPVEP